MTEINQLKTFSALLNVSDPALFSKIDPDVFQCIFTIINFLDIQSFLKIIFMHKVFNFMMVLQGIQTMLGYLQFSVCILYIGQTKRDTLKSFSVATNEDYPQQKYLS